MVSNIKKFSDKIFRDKNGHIVLWQWPNFLLWAWLIITILSHIFKQDQPRTGLELTASALLFSWAYLEITSGVNYFRKALGIIVLSVIIFHFFGK
ncbi:MAG: hypothetical protein ACR2FM_01995 [Candidatus Saccharimonadales bacterium]